MNETICNEYLQIAVSRKGAELQSLISKKTGTEYLWQGDPAHWEGRAPVLFPVVGSLKGGKYQYNGQEYEMPKHGFARTAMFTCEKKSDTELCFGLEDDEQTRKLYPFAFRFEVIFRLDGQTLFVDYAVKNRTDGEILFSMGAHEAFRCPRADGEAFSDYELVFSEEDKYRTLMVDLVNGVMTGEETPVFEGKTLGLRHSLFEKDALVFGDIKSKTVTLRSEKSNGAVEVTYHGADNLGIWTKVGAPYVCIEPWCGLPDFADSTGNLVEKRGIVRLERDGEYVFTHGIRIVE